MEIIKLSEHLLDLSLNHLIISIGSIIGSFKASQLLSNVVKPLCYQWLDISLGIFIGILLGHYYQNQENLYLTGFVSLLGGVSGVIVIETLFKMLPKLSKEAITALFERIKG